MRPDAVADGAVRLPLFPTEARATRAERAIRRGRRAPVVREPSATSAPVPPMSPFHGPWRLSATVKCTELSTVRPFHGAGRACARGGTEPSDLSSHGKSGACRPRLRVPGGLDRTALRRPRGSFGAVGNVVGRAKTRPGPSFSIGGIRRSRRSDLGTCVACAAGPEVHAAREGGVPLRGAGTDEGRASGSRAGHTAMGT